MQHWPWRQHNQQDRRAEFEQIASAHAGDLYGAALRITRNRDDADDLIQDTLVKAYAAFSSFMPGTNFRAWTLRILTNNYLTLYRRRQQVQFVPWDDELEASQFQQGIKSDATGEPEPALLGGILDPELEMALARLSEGIRLAVLLVDVEALTYEEAAAALGIPVGTVRSRLTRGREQMRSGLASFAREHNLTPDAEKVSSGRVKKHGSV